MTPAAVVVLLALRARAEVSLRDRCRGAFGTEAAYGAWLKLTADPTRIKGATFEAGAHRLTASELEVMAEALAAHAPQPVTCGAVRAGRSCHLAAWHEGDEHQSADGSCWLD